ncbi:SRF-TF domain-containing protein/K-box domain-containing protein, partial [Cephalotus follicularis]
MARGKIQIKKIENLTNRQVTFSKRRNGLFKKANELTVLCDAKVSIIMLSSTGRLHHYISPSTTMKEMFDLYQKALPTDLWCSLYEKMQEDLKKHVEVNRNLRREIRQRMGESLNESNFEELCSLEQDMDSSLQVIRIRKYRWISNQIETCKKKIRNLESIHVRLLQEFDARNEDPQYGLVDNEEDDGPIIGFQNLSLQRNQPNLHSGAGSNIATYSLLE